MDRAEKVRQYRKRIKGAYSRKRRQESESLHFGGIGMLAAGALFAAGIFALVVLAPRKNETSDLGYVSRQEFVSLMSFLSEDFPADRWEENPEAAVTQGQLKDFLQVIGLSGMISAEGGNAKPDRASVMDYYDRIRDYLDLEEAVRQDTILLLDQDGKICQTQDGEKKLNTDFLNLKPFYTYDAYMMDDTILGIRAASNKTVALKDVLVREVTKKSVVFEYEDREYEAACTHMDGLKAQMYGTLCMKGGKITKVKDIESADTKAETAKAAEEKGNAAYVLPDTVKVLLLNEGGVHYSQVSVTCNGSFSVTWNGKKKKHKKSVIVDSANLNIKKGGCVTIAPDKSADKLFLVGGTGEKISKGYYGRMVIYRDKEGYYIVNKVNIEKYLYSVVASEMPSYFGLEALKAQAVCARSYVYRQMQSQNYVKYHAQIDDSTYYQVYNKAEISDACVRAVKETAGEIMDAGGEIVNAYYYSASCGYGSGMEIWSQKAADYPYLKAKPICAPGKGKTLDLSDEKTFRTYIASDAQEAFDSDSPYFRWKAQIELSACLEEFKQKIRQRQEINPQNISFYTLSAGKARKTDSLDGFGGVKNISCSKRSKSGGILELSVDFEFGRVTIRMEYNIRSVLGCALEKVTYANGHEDTAVRFLPSAYFSISFDQKSGRYMLKGGGNGHGMGMSQYAADNMAEKGWNYRKILKYFYDGITIEKVK